MSAALFYAVVFRHEKQIVDLRHCLMAGKTKGDVFGTIPCCIANKAAVGQDLYEPPIARCGAAARGQFFHLEHGTGIDFAFFGKGEAIFHHGSARRHGLTRFQAAVAAFDS